MEALKLTTKNFTKQLENWVENIATLIMKIGSTKFLVGTQDTLNGYEIR